MSHEAASPREIMAGMVVNIQATPALVPTKKGTLKMILKLRSVMIVCDGAFKASLLSLLMDADALLTAMRINRRLCSASRPACRQTIGRL